MEKKSNKKIEFYNEKLYEIRKSKGLSQEELADKINVSRQTIYAWESGKSIPDTVNIAKLCEVLEIEPDVMTSALKTKEKKENNSNFRKLKIIIIVVILFVAILFLISSIYKAIILSNLNKKLSDLENISNYYYKITEFKSKGKDVYDLITTEVFYKDGKLKMITSDGNTRGVIVVDYNKNEGYLLNDKDKTRTKIDLENALLSDENGIRAIGTSLLDNNNINNVVYAFNPFLHVLNDENSYVLIHKIKVGDYEATVEEKIDKDTGIPISIVEYGNDGVNIQTNYEIKIDNVAEEDVEIDNLEDYDNVK